MGMWCGGRWPTFSGGNGGGLARWDHPHTNIHKTPSPVRGLVTLCLPRRSWVQPGWLQTFCMSLSMHVCVWVCVFVCDTNGVPAWATICHPPSQREALGRWGGGRDPRRLKPPVGSFSQSHAGRAPCLKSHGYLSGLGMEGGGRMGGETILTVIDAL